MLSRGFVFLTSVNHNVKWLKSGFNNACLISQSGVSVTHALLVMYAEISLEDASPSCLWSLASQEVSRGIKTSFHLILAAGKGQGQRGFELAHHHMFLYLPSLASGRHTLSPCSGYCYLCGLCAMPDPDRCGSFPNSLCICSHSLFFMPLIEICTNKNTLKWLLRILKQKVLKAKLETASVSHLA